MITELTQIELPYPIALGPVAIENACNLIVDKTGHYMNGYTLFVSSTNIGLALKLMAVMPRVGVQLDETLGAMEWKLAGITPQMQIVCVHCEA